MTGRVYKDAPTPGSSTLARNVRRLTASGWAGAPLTLSFEGQTVQVRTGAGGVFTATLRPPEGGAGWEAGLHRVTARVPGARAQAPVEVVSDAAPFVVISDFDDTLAQSHVLNPGRLLASALLHDGDTLPAVAGMEDFYRCLRDGKAALPGFALVSGSPDQYSPRVLRFLVRHGFPFFGLYLRDLRPDTLRGYKQPRIRHLLGQLAQPVVLVGDSGEHDPEVYAEVRAAFPGRVLQVYIRDVGRAGDPGRFEGMMRFREPREAAWHAARHGLASEACVRAAFGAPAGAGR